MNLHRLAGSVLGTTVIASSLITMTNACAATAVDPTRVLIVGDSVTHGSDGDYTWRYFSYKGLAQTGANVDFVGPNTDTAYGAGGYADPNFDQDHAARWGLSMWETLYQPSDTAPRISTTVAAQDPDVIVEMLGANDFIWFNLDAAAMSDQVREFVAEARAVKADVDVVLAGVPQTWINDRVAVYNDGLPALAADLSTPESRVVAAPVAQFTEGVDTYDNVHPSVSGEIKLAKSVSVALEELGIGTAIEMTVPAVTPPLTPPVVIASSPVVVPEPAPSAAPPLTPPVTIPESVAAPALAAPVLRVKALWKGRIRVSWAAHVGATRLWARDVTARRQWALLTEVVATVTSHTVRLPRGHRIKVRAAAVLAGGVSLSSAVVSVRAR